MDRNEQVGAGAIRDSGALGEADENVGRARELGADAVGFQSGFETRRDLQREILLHRAGGRLRAGIVAAMTGIDHHEKMTRLPIVLIQSTARCGRDWRRERNRTRILRRRERDRARDGRGRAPRNVVVNDDRRRDIRIRAGGRDPQHDFVSVAEPRDRVVGLADHLDDDSRAAVRLDRANAQDRRRLISRTADAAESRRACAPARSRVRCHAC